MSRWSQGIFTACALLALSLATFLNTADAADRGAFDHQSFARIAVLDQGRIKPLDTYARSYLKTFSGRDAIEDVTAAAWLAEVVFDSASAIKRPVFNIPNPEVADAIGLPKKDGHRYSYEEVSAALDKNRTLVHSLFARPKEQITLAQDQLMDLYNNAQTYLDILNSFSMVVPIYVPQDKNIADALGLKLNEPVSFMDLRGKWDLMESLVSATKSDAFAKELRGILSQMSKIERAPRSDELRIVPPVWKENKDEWFSAWGVSGEGAGSPETAKYITLLGGVAKAYVKSDAAAFRTRSEELRAMGMSMAGEKVKPQLIELEVFFNEGNFFLYSMVAYIASFLLLLASRVMLRRQTELAARVALTLGCVLHATGIVMRMIIMERPPVSTLYESILFVGLIAAVFGALVEWRRRNCLGVLIGSVSGAALQFLGMRYNSDGDSMGMLVAVLNTNFWLATHVVTITIGYGCSLVGGVLAHVYLGVRYWAPEQKQAAKELYANMQGAAIVAIFFASLGTILGGIWADQSWGRFWGWDPKENGALLIVLWLALLIHGRLSGILTPLHYAMCMVATNIMVAVAWFGVNLLNIGLHSYGFTRHVAINLGSFCAAELVFIVVMAWLITRREREVVA